MKMGSRTTTIRVMRTGDKADMTGTDRMVEATVMDMMRMGITSKGITMAMIINDSRMTMICGEEA